MNTFGFIGMGNMGHAMLNGILKEFNTNQIMFTDTSEIIRAGVSEDTGVISVPTNIELANSVKYIVLAVKPQCYDEVIRGIRNVVTHDKIIISLAPGITINDVQDKFDSDVRVVRCMPNTPALIGEGMTGVSYDSRQFVLEEVDTISRFFNSFGKFRIVEEKLLNTVTCVSGSSPAYVYMFIEALADSAVKYGMSRNDAIEFAAMTVKGAADMVLTTKEHPAVLKDRVCSPGGTTIAGVSALEENNFRHAIIAATDKCYEKCTGLKK
ncbi:MAG: pyrroline-5-carboxylate reductase [Butyrivibrio sp.]